LFQKILSAVSLYDRFNDLNSGVFSITGVVYFISVTVFFLFLCVESLEKRRWS
jgi:ABC-2 type transport system permease protein